MRRGVIAWLGLAVLLPLRGEAAQFRTRSGGFPSASPRVKPVVGAANGLKSVPILKIPVGGASERIVVGAASGLKVPAGLPALPDAAVAKAIRDAVARPGSGEAPDGPSAERSGEELASEGRVKFDNAKSGGSLWESLKGMLGAPSSSPKVRLDHPVASIEKVGGAYWINGKPARELGFGTYKIVVRHPEDPRFVVKIFDVKLTVKKSLEEKDLEVRNIRSLEKIGATPRLHQEGAVRLGGRDVGFVVVERVDGLTLRVPTPRKLKDAQGLFERLAAEGIEVTDSHSAGKLRSNLMVGETPSGGWGIYLTDPDVAPSAKSRAQLRAFYEGLHALLSSPH